VYSWHSVAGVSRHHLHGSTLQCWPEEPCPEGRAAVAVELAACRLLCVYATAARPHAGVPVGTTVNGALAGGSLSERSGAVWLEDLGFQHADKG
jgi:hypothetical protein